MPDPLEALRSPVIPTYPDPSFAANLRARLEKALNLPRGVLVSELTFDPQEVPSTPPGLRHGDVAYASLWVPDVERAAAFFSAVVGWHYAPGSGPQGRQVQGTTPRQGLWGGQERSNLFLCFAVDDVEQAVQRVREAGGQADAPRIEPYGAVVDCEDNQGTPLALVQAAPRPAGAAPDTGAGPGDLAYLVLEVVDAAEARDFYASVLGWQFTRGSVDDGWQAPDVVPMVGMVGGQDRATVVPMYQVDDITSAVERARAAGGTADDPERHPYGTTSLCTDDQGTRFYLGEL